MTTTLELQVDNDDGREGLPSASGFARIANCPGSPAAERGLPPLPEQRVTAQGTNIHEALHTGDDEDLELTEKEIKERIAAMEQAAVGQWREDFNITEEPSVVREQRFWIRDRQTLDPLVSAKPDVVYHTATHALVLDFKTGFANPTDSERNWQCRTQAVAFWSDYPQLEHIRAGIVASRLVSKLDLTEYGAEDLRRVEREIRHAVWRTEQPDAPRVPGSWCRWCRASGTCRESATYSLIVANQMPMMGAKPDQLAIIDKVGRMTPQELAYVHEREAIAKVVFDSVEARMKQLPEDVLSSIGYKLAPGNKGVEITDVAIAFSKLGTLLSDEERMRVIGIVEGRAIEIVAEKQNISKDKAKAKVREALKDVQREKIGQPRLKQL